MAQTPTKPTTEDLAAQMDVLRNDIASLTNMLGERTRAEANEAANAAKRVARRARANAEDQYDHLQARANDVAEQADEFIHEKPGMAIGLAAAAGLIAGLMLSRRS